jgi:hypothetical protein
VSDIRDSLAADERTILRHLDQRGPMSVRDLLHAIAPIPTDATAAVWTSGRLRLRDADTRLAELGLVEGPADARRITPAGRDELTRIANGGER